MITALDDLSILQNHDGVGVPHGGETVGDHEGGPFCHQAIHAPLDNLFCVGVDGAGSLIENQHRGVGAGSPGDIEQLPLALG